MNDLLYEAQLILDRAEDSLEYAETNLKLGITIVTVNRAYYSVFYCVSALLFTENILPKTHKGALMKFNEMFVKNSKLPAKMSNWAKKAEEPRQSADYDLTSEISDEEANESLQNAHEFYNLTKAYLAKLIADAPQ